MWAFHCWILCSVDQSEKDEENLTLCNMFRSQNPAYDVGLIENMNPYSIIQTNPERVWNSLILGINDLITCMTTTKNRAIQNPAKEITFPVLKSLYLNQIFNWIKPFRLKIRATDICILKPAKHSSDKPRYRHFMYL